MIQKHPLSTSKPSFVEAMSREKTHAMWLVFFDNMIQPFSSHSIFLVSNKCWSDSFHFVKYPLVDPDVFAKHIEEGWLIFSYTVELQNDLKVVEF